MSRKNYITAPTLYQTGFLYEQTPIRQKQGLAPQELSGACQQPHTLTGLYSVPLEKRGVFNSDNMYPVNLPEVNYGSGRIPKYCPCAKYVLPA